MQRPWPIWGSSPDSSFIRCGVSAVGRDPIVTRLSFVEAQAALWQGRPRVLPGLILPCANRQSLPCVTVRFPMPLVSSCGMNPGTSQGFLDTCEPVPILLGSGQPQSVDVFEIRDVERPQGGVVRDGARCDGEVDLPAPSPPN